MQVANRKWIFERMKHSLQHLACPAEVQIQLFPPFVCVTDELALNFHHWREVFFDNYKSELTTDQASSLETIDQKFEAFGKEVELFWTEEALRQSAQWESIRKLAVQSLQSLGWALEIPPSYAHEYAKGEQTAK